MRPAANRYRFAAKNVIVPPGQHLMFRIYRYFAIVSAVVILAVMTVLGLVYQRNAIATLVDVAENQNVALARTLSNIILSRFGTYLDSRPVTAELRSEADGVTSLLSAATDDSRILKIKIYSTSGLTLYSSDPGDLGLDRRDQPRGDAFVGARNGVPQSKLSFKDRFSAFSGEVFNRDVVETYVPIDDDSGQVMGVFEVYSDVTNLKNRIDNLILAVLLFLLLVFGLLYALLVFGVMRRAIAPLRLASQQAAAIGPQSTGVRLPTQGMAAEVLPLVLAVNGALDRLDKALEAQRQFTADAAHELLTPLAVLRANVDTIEDKETGAALRQDLDTMSDLVTQLLELAEFDGLDPGQVEVVDPAEICVDVAAMMAPAAHAEKKEIAFVGPDRAVTVRTCPKSLARALRNLVKNALAATPAGTTVEIRLLADGRIQVMDEGPGVPPDKRDVIFRRFWRGLHGNRPGAGLGLSIVKRFVDTYGGVIEVDDARGGGAVFTLSLPRVQETAGSQAGEPAHQ